MSTSSSAEPSPRFDAGEWASPWFSGRRVVVTGGSSGIGRGIAQAFAAAGASVLAVGATEAEALTAKVEDDADDREGDIEYRALDVRNTEAVSQIIGAETNLAALVNCAGVIRRGDEFSPDVFSDVLDVNVSGTMRCCMAARPALVIGGGAVVNLASMLSFFGGGLVPGYSASKGGVAQLTKSLAIAWAPEHIRVNAIAPGWIRTALTARIQENDERADAILKRTPMARWGESGDLAGPALFLCTPMASFITGAIVPVDGGYSSC